MYLRLSPYREVLQGVITSLQVNEGIIKIIGKSGSGKTALCSQLFHELEANGQPAVFFLKPPASATALQNDILDNLKLDPVGNFTRTLTAYLVEKTTQQKPLVLIFDDAQQLDPQTFSAIRMLCNIQDKSRAMVRVVLCGNEELDAKLAAPALRAVTQFLSQSFTLPYLTQDQVNDFCHGYWMLMGEDMKPMHERVLQKLFQETRGHPGILQARLNQGATGADKGDRQSREDDKVAVPSRPYRYSGPRKNWVPALLIMTGLIVLGGVGVYMYLIPSFFEDTVYPAVPPVAVQRQAEAEPVSGPAEEAVPEVAATTPEPPVATPEEVPVAEVADTTAVVAVTAPDAAPVDAPVESAADEAVESVAAETVADENAAAEQPAEQALLSVEDFIAAWAVSWQSKDIDAYLASYHPAFVPPQGATLAAWQEQRRRVITNAVDIMVSADAPESIREAQEGMRLVRFWLNYSTANYADRTLKELLLVPVAGTWQIRVENNLRTERE